MKRTLLGTLAAVAAAAALSAFGFATTAAAQDDKQPTHAELVQRWAEAAIERPAQGHEDQSSAERRPGKALGPV